MGCAQTKQLSTVVNKAGSSSKKQDTIDEKEMAQVVVDTNDSPNSPIIVPIIEMRSRRKAIVAKTWGKKVVSPVNVNAVSVSVSTSKQPKPLPLGTSSAAAESTDVGTHPNTPVATPQKRPDASKIASIFPTKGSTLTAHELVC